MSYLSAAGSEPLKRKAVIHFRDQSWKQNSRAAEAIKERERQSKAPVFPTRCALKDIARDQTVEPTTGIVKIIVKDHESTICEKCAEHRVRELNPPEPEKGQVWHLDGQDVTITNVLKADTLIELRGPRGLERVRRLLFLLDAVIVRDVDQEPYEVETAKPEGVG